MSIRTRNLTNHPSGFRCGKVPNPFQPEMVQLGFSDLRGELSADGLGLWTLQPDATVLRDRWHLLHGASQSQRSITEWAGMRPGPCLRNWLTSSIRK